MADTIRKALERLLAVIKPKYTDPDEIVAVVRAMAAARTSLAAEPPAPAPAIPLDLDALLSPKGAYEPGTGQEDGAQLVDLCWWAPVHGCDTLENLLDRIRLRILPHLRPPIAGNMVPAADDEREELAALLIGDAECMEADQPDLMSATNHQLRRAAALLRQLPPEGLSVEEYFHIDSGARIISEPSEEWPGRGCWTVRNSRHVNPRTEFRTVADAVAALKQEVGDE